MRGAALGGLLAAAILVGAGIGYLSGGINAGGRAGSVSTTSLSFTATSFFTTTVRETATSTSVQTMTTTVNTATTTIWGTPIPIASVETAEFSVGGSPSTVAVNPNDSRIYVAGDSNVLTVVDAVSHAVVARVTLPSASNSGIATDYKTGTVFVSVQGGVVEINGTTNTVVKELPLDTGYRSIAFDSATDTVYGSSEKYVGTNGSGYLVGANARTGAITQNVSIGYWASDILVNPHLDLVYAVGCAQSFVCGSVVSVVNGTNGQLIRQTSLESAYYETATIDQTTGTVYLSGEAQLVALNPYGAVTFNYYPDTCGPFISMADDPALNQVIMAPQNYNYLLVYNGWFGNLVNMYSLPDAPQYVAFNPATNETYVILSSSLVIFHGVAGIGHVNDTLIGAGQFCLPV